MAELVKISTIDIDIGSLNQDFIKITDIAAEARKSVVRTKGVLKFAKYSYIIC